MFVFFNVDQKINSIFFRRFPFKDGIPPTAFSFFTKETRHLISEKNPDHKFGEISKLVGQQWQGLDTKTRARFQKLEAEDKQRYHVARQQVMDDYAARMAVQQQAELAETQRQEAVAQAAEAAGLAAVEASRVAETAAPKKSRRTKAQKNVAATQETDAKPKKLRAKRPAKAKASK